MESKRTASKSKVLHESKLPENANPNLKTPNPKSSKSASVKSAVKKPNQATSPSPRKTKIRDRKFIVAKKNSKSEKGKIETVQAGNCKCKANSSSKKCLCVAYESLRASQHEFSNVVNPNSEKLGESEKVSAIVKRRREKLLEVARQSIPENGCGRVMHLVKAFENALTLPKPKIDSDNEEENEEPEDEIKKVLKWELPGLRPRAPVTEFSSPELVLTRESLGLDSNVSSGSLGSNSNRNSGSGRRSRRNSLESSATCGGSRTRTCKATSQQPFKLKTEQRGRAKQEEFVKKVQDMMIEQEKQRIRVAQGLPWTTDEPECLARPPVKERTLPVDLVLRSDMRAVERAEFDQHVQEKLSFIEQHKLQREREQKLAEEEELRRLRKELVPKAQPMPYFDRPFVPKRSEKQPTLPKEPRFHNPQQKKI
ncbi:microtubule-destabilizing protein 60 isoform X2 [Rutidosis leptorrhynchoides]|uniref:microtubule-destabilizing protein 60 isoform X2 n=1 Tax=Rutidosis leptorrhynchoides TaxID=125765 RepID=UPI003A9940C8